MLAVLVVRQSDPDLGRAPGRVQVECQPFGLISTLRLALIRGISDGTPVSGSDDKTSERQQPDPQTHFRALKNGAGRERLLMPTGAAFIQGKGPADPLHLIVLGPLTP